MSQALANYDPNAFDDNFQPKDIVGRQKELSLLSSQEQSMLVMGPAGSGKSAVMKHSTKGRKCRSVYVDCGVSMIEWDVLQQIVVELGLGGTEGKSYSKALKMIGAAIKNQGCVHVYLDDYQFFRPSPENTVIMGLLKVGVRMIICVNDMRFWNEMSEPIKSRMSPKTVLFAPYKADVLQKILDMRLQTAFKGDWRKHVNEEALAFLCAHVASSSGDARRALLVMRSAIDNTTTDGRTKVVLDDVKKVLDELPGNPVFGKLLQDKEFPADVKMIVIALAKYNLKNQGIQSLMTLEKLHQIFRDACKEVGYGDRSWPPFRDAVATAEAYGFLNLTPAKGMGMGIHGRAKLVTFNPNAEANIAYKIQKGEL